MNWKRLLLSNIPRAADAGGAGSGGAGAGAGGAGGGAGGTGGAAGGAAAGAGAGGAAGGGAAGAGAGGGGAGAGGGQQPYYDSWGVEQQDRDWLASQGYTDPKSLVKGARNHQQLARDRNVMARPDPAKLNDWDGWSELGWKPKLDDYKFTAPHVPDGMTYSGELFDEVRKIAHDNRIPLAAAQKLHDGIWSFMANKTTQLRSSGAGARKQLDDALRAEWKGDYDVNTATARRAFQAFNPNPDDMAAVNAAMGDPRAVKMFAAIGKAIGEASLPAGGNAGGGGQTPEAARAERLRLESDAEWMKVFNSDRHPLKADHTAHRNRLLDLEAKGRR